MPRENWFQNKTAFYEFFFPKIEIDVTVESSCLQELTQITETEKEKGCLPENFTDSRKNLMYVIFICLKTSIGFSSKYLYFCFSVIQISWLMNFSLKNFISWTKTVILISDFQKAWSWIYCQDLDYLEFFARVATKILARNPRNLRSWQEIQKFQDLGQKFKIIHDYLRSWQENQDAKHWENDIFASICCR